MATMVNNQPRKRYREFGVGLMGVCGLALAGSGCLILPTPDAPRMAVPPHFTGEATVETRVVEQSWWRSFDDAALNQLVDHALGANLDLRIAAARLQQAEAIANQAGAGLWPQISLSSRAGRSKIVLPGTDLSFVGTRLSGSAIADYEVDLWGKVRARARAGDLDFLANQDTVHAALMSMAATVTSAWFNLLLSRARLDLTTAQLKTNSIFLQLTTLRYQKGLASSLDVHQQRQEVAASKARLAQLEGQAVALKISLNLLLGGLPHESLSAVSPAQANGRRLPAVPAGVVVGVPADLLASRPDVVAARRRVVAADYRAGAAVADLLPSIRLGGSLGLNARTFVALFNDFVWNLFAGLTQPLFEGGRRKYEVDRNDAVLRERLFEYRNTVLTALGEVESALAREQAQDVHIGHLHEQVTHAEAALREAKNRYANGLVDFLRVLSATQGLQRLQQSVLQAERDALDYRVQLHRALGGSWMAGRADALLAAIDVDRDDGEPGTAGQSPANPAQGSDRSSETGGTSAQSAAPAAVNPSPPADGGEE